MLQTENNLNAFDKCESALKKHSHILEAPQSHLQAAFTVRVQKMRVEKEPFVINVCKYRAEEFLWAD